MFGLEREKRFIKKLKRRDEKAFSELVRTHQHRIFNVVFRMLGNVEEARDVSQEVFVTIFRSIDSFRGECRLATWIYRIATNRCRNRMKSLRRRGADRTSELDAVPEQQLSTSTPELIAMPDQLLEAYQLEDAVQQALNVLDDDFREILILRDIEGLSYQEIAEILQLPEGTVKSRLHRARFQLRDRLKPYLR